MKEYYVYGGAVLIWICLMILIIAIYIFLIRWVFKINKMERLQQQQVDLLTAIARTQGVDAETLNTILHAVRK